MKLIAILAFAALSEFANANTHSDITDQCGYRAAWAYAAALAREDGFSERTTLGFLRDVEEPTRDVVREVFAGERMQPELVREVYFRKCISESGGK